ncbi:MAG: CCA tRNA nucleotidyltransferase [Anaerolineae bacterium]
MTNPKATPSQKIDTSLYLNRWVAIVRERVIGVGQTRAQAERAAKQIRPKDRPLLLYVDSGGNLTDAPPQASRPADWFTTHPLLRQVAEVLQRHQIEAYLVGGAVRDFLLNRRPVMDLDFALPGDGLKAARQVADALNASYYPLDIERKTGRVVCDAPSGDRAVRFHLDFAALRGRDLAADLADRDFTINAIALSLLPDPRLIDPLGGQQDLQAQRIAAAAPTAFRRDPVRAIRAVRQAVAFGFTITPETRRLIADAAALLPLVSSERQRDELMKLLNTPRPGSAVSLLHQLGVLLYLVPEAAAMAGVPQSPPHHLDVLRHTTLAMDTWAEMARHNWLDAPPELRLPLNDYFDALPAGEFTLRELMPLALLLHDTGKPITHSLDTADDSQVRHRFINHEQRSAGIARKFCKRFHFSNQAQDFVEAVVRQHMRPLQLSTGDPPGRRAIFRYFRDCQAGRFSAGPAVALHALADHRATYPPGEGQPQESALLAVAHRLLAAYFREQEQVVDPPPLLSGRDLIDEFGLKPGRLIGVLLGRLKEAQAVGQVQTRAEALTFVQNDPDLMRHLAEN